MKKNYKNKIEYNISFPSILKRWLSLQVSIQIQYLFHQFFFACYLFMDFEQSQFNHKKKRSMSNRERQIVLKLDKSPSDNSKENTQEKSVNVNVNRNKSKLPNVISKSPRSTRTDPKKVLQKFLQMKKKSQKVEVSSDELNIIKEIQLREKKMEQLQVQSNDLKSQRNASNKLYQEALKQGNQESAKIHLSRMQVCAQQRENIRVQRSELRVQISELKKQLYKIRDSKI